VARACALALGLALAVLRPDVGRAADAIVCSPGTEPREAARAGGRDAWCERTGTNPKVREGPFVSWHVNGAVSIRGQYRDGKPSGDWKSWHATAAQSGEVTFVDGKPTGMLLGWYPNGQASFVGGFRDGTPIGAMELFDPDGRMRGAADFGPDGTERSRRAWDDANRAIDPGSPAAQETSARALQSTPLIYMALTAASAPAR